MDVHMNMFQIGPFLWSCIIKLNNTVRKRKQGWNQEKTKKKPTMLKFDKITTYKKESSSLAIYFFK